MARALGLLCVSLLLWLAGLSATAPVARHARVARAAGDLAAHTSRGLPELALRHATPMLRVAPAEQRHGAGGGGGGGGSSSAHRPAPLTAGITPATSALVLQGNPAAHVGDALRRPYDANAPPRTRALA